MSRQSTEEAESQRKSVFSLKNFWSCSWVEKPESAVEVVDLVSSMSMAVEQPQIEDCSRIVREAPTPRGPADRHTEPGCPKRAIASQ